MGNSVMDHILKKYSGSLDFDIKDFSNFKVSHVVNDVVSLISSYEMKDTIPEYEAAYRIEKINRILKGLKDIEERLNQ